MMRLFLPVTDPYPQGPTKESGYSLFVGITYWITCLAIGVFDMLQHIRASKRILFRTGLILALALTALWIPLVQWDHAILKKWRRIENQQQQESVLEQPRQGATRT
ncbi:MAG: hypothetical protein HN909_01440 [Phycisphaerales bacterium]|nr:hypothetical protein [Phycisphaerales bacterium]